MKKLDPINWKDAFKWQYEAYPIFTSVYVNASNVEIENKYYTNWADFINNFENGHLLAFKPNKEILKIGNIAIKESLSGKSGYLREIKKIHREMDSAIELCFKAISKKTSSLSGWWTQTQKALSHAANILFSFDYTFDGFLKDLQGKNQKDFEVLNRYIKNNKLSFLDEATKKLLELNKKSPKNFDKVFDNFIKEFGWFQNTYKGIFRIDKQWLKKYFTEIKNKNIELHSNEKKKEVLPGRYRIIVELANDVIIFRDDKKKLLLLAVELIDNWLNKQCHKNKWKYEIMRWLTVDEVLDIIQRNKTKNLSMAEQYYKENRRLGIMTHTGYGDIDKKFWQEIIGLYENVEDKKEIRGIVASKGFCRGKARVIFDTKEKTIKFDEGDILVTSMTRPEFSSLMNKACAFVTDEGGISCHAAIIAREMKKPCIIATKNATRIIKDGDLVEVDADNGVVRIIKKA